MKQKKWIKKWTKNLQFNNITQNYIFVTSTEKFCEKCNRFSAQDIYVVDWFGSNIFYVCNYCNKITKKRNWND